MRPDPRSGRHARQHEAQRRTAATWLRQRPRSWWWVLGFLVVLALVLLWLYAAPTAGPA